MSKRKELRSIDELIHALSHRKGRAAQYRFGGRHSASESSRVVYLESCSTIASAFTPFGYQYRRREHCFYLTQDNLTFQVSFQSSIYNVPGEYVALWLHVYVLSKALEGWRRQQAHSIRQTDYVAGGQIGSLLDNPVWMEWNLANPKHRKICVEDAVDTIKKIALPYFAQFEDLKEFIERLRGEAIPAMNIGSTIEFLLCYGSREIATKAGTVYLSHHPDASDEFIKLNAEYKSQGLPKYSGIGDIRELAFVSVAHGLNLANGA